MNIGVRESPLPPSTMDVFLFFCNQEEQFLAVPRLHLDLDSCIKAISREKSMGI